MLRRNQRCSNRVTNSLEFDRRRPAELVCFTSRELTELLHRRVQSTLCQEGTHAPQQPPVYQTSPPRSKQRDIGSCRPLKYTRSWGKRVIGIELLLGMHKALPSFRTVMVLPSI